MNENKDIKLKKSWKFEHPGVQERFFYAISKGAKLSLACKFAGCSISVISRWLKKGEKLELLHEEQIENHPDKKFFDFFVKYRQVESAAAINLLDCIDNAARVDWRAAAWKLGKLYPEDYGNDIKKDEIQDKEIERAREEIRKLKESQNVNSV